MVITNLNSPELKLYEKLDKNFSKAFEVLRDYMKNFPEAGKYYVDGEKVYCSVQCYKTKLPAESKFEAHKKYIDIQAVIEGSEIIRFESAEKLSHVQQYDEQSDCELYAMSKEFDSVRLTAGELAIIFPGEPHSPCITTSTVPTDVKKVVVKVLYEE